MQRLQAMAAAAKEADLKKLINKEAANGAEGAP